MKLFPITILLAFASAVALLCAGLIVQTTAVSSDESSFFQAGLWQRETQTLVMIGIYFAVLALLTLIGKLAFIKK